MLFYEPHNRDRAILPHDPFKALVAPRPIGWVSTLSADGVLNLAPYSFFNAVGERPAMLAFSSTGFKHSAGFAGDTSRLVAPPRVAASPCAIECRVVHRLELHDVDGRPTNQHLVVGQVIGVHLDERFIVDGRVDTVAMRPIARCGYRGDYTVVERLFEMLRPGT